MMSSSLLDNRENTNISICAPAAQISHALAMFKQKYPPKLDGVRPLAEHLARVTTNTSMGWETEGVAETATDC